MKEIAENLYNMTSAAIDGFVCNMQEWFQETFEPKLHEFCDEYQLRFDCWSMGFYNRQGFRIDDRNVTDPILREDLYAIRRALQCKLSPDEDDTLGSTLGSYTPWNK